MAIRQLPDGRWMVYYRVRGDDGKSRVKWEAFGRGALAEACAIARNAELGLLRRRPAKQSTGPSFIELATEYHEKRGLNANSRKQLWIRLEAHLFPVFGAQPAMAIKSHIVDNYVETRRLDGVSDATIARELTDLKSILNWSVKRSPPLITVNPIAAYSKPRTRNPIARPPTTREALRILDKARPHLKRAILLSWYLGLRPGAVELLSLCWDAVNWESRRLLVTSAHKGGPQAREVPIHPELYHQLKRWRTEDRKHGRRHIVHYYGRAVKSIGRAWRAAVKAAKIGRAIRPYDLRHHFVTKALEGGADLKSLSEVVGSSPATLLKFYQHVTSEQHQKTVALVPPLAKPPKKR
jgi:integrase